MKKLINFLPLIILILVAITGILAIYKIQQKQDLEARLENQELIDFPNFSFENLFENGEKLTNKDFQNGSKYSIVNVFASWCSTCYLEHPTLLQLSQNKNFNLYGIAFRDVDENTREYLAKNKNPFLKTAVDKKGELARMIGVTGVPETFIINEKGQVISRFKGNIPTNFGN